MRVGIPNSFCYMGMERFLADFISRISASTEAIFSGPTTNEMVELGIQNSIEEICMPAKLLVGHIEYLVKNTDIDILLLPRLASISYKTYSCPKIIGIPDLVKAHYNHMRIISPELNLRNGISCIDKFLVELGRHFISDIRRLRNIVKNFSGRNLFEYLPLTIKEKKNILILGHSYVIFDNNLNKRILQLIKSGGYNPLYPSYNYISIDTIVSDLPKPFFWSTAQNIYEYFWWAQKNLKLDGVI
ncbi:acyl-CoA dehydratase activase-related protein [Caldicellulosiruptor naganoensis]|uniref:Acyl-CoA dehydratase activase-related protein n=1 Tax=Caldicellulosiruptor naganoensis TaxID=29324 RepID=A0ABY7BGN6_9FIRM|nr:acyl-CoA dehydratase activase-related protein [Caldicellulosiruptor naganoensis]WAM30504.1 acyl-CoA dehydratase activase-related protein [Caldicellulosiruptor naganoensis]